MFRICLAGLVLLLGLSAGTAWASEYRIPGMRTNDVFYTDDGLRQKLTNRVVLYDDGSRARYNRNGTYVYQKVEGGPELTGRYSFKPKGMVCVRFDSGRNRCDTYVRSAKHTYILSSGGGRMKVKGIVRE